MNAAGTGFVSIGEWQDGRTLKAVSTSGLEETQAKDNAAAHPWVIEVWKSGKPRYAGCTTVAGPGVADPHALADISLIDVPFSQGTLAINRRLPNAFGDENVAQLQRFAQVLSDGFQRFRDLAERSQRERRRLAASLVREQVWNMKHDGDLTSVLDTVGHVLRDASVVYRDCDINLVEQAGEALSVRHYDPEKHTWTMHSVDAAARIAAIWRTASTAYRRDLAAEDHHGDGDLIERDLGRRPRSAVDVPFSGGTLAVNSDQPNGFSPEDIEVLQDVSRVLTEGFTRMGDLQRLAQRDLELERSVVERQELEAELVHAERQNAATELAAGISHNLNNVLTSVILPAEFLALKSEEPEVVRREAESIRLAGERARDLVQRLSDAVRPDEDPEQAVDLNRQVQEMVERAKPRWRDHPKAMGITVEVVTELGDIPNAVATSIE